MNGKELNGERWEIDPRDSAQDIVQCDLCKDNIVQNFCDVCYVNLCKQCIGEHISDGYHKHAIVPFQQQKSILIFPICKTHSKETCKLQCKSCDAFVCAICCISEEHKGHDFSILEDSYNSKIASVEKDTDEMLNLISPAYENIRKQLESHITGLDGEYKKLTAILSKQGEDWHKEIDGVINQMNTELNEIKANHRDILMKHLKEIERIEALLKENMSTLKALKRVSNVVSTIMEYTSRNSEFRKPPSKVDVSFPTFCPKPMDREKVYTLIGSIKPLTFTKNENGYILEKQRNASKELLDTPEVINTFNTGYKNPRSVAQRTTIWATGESAID